MTSVIPSVVRMRVASRRVAQIRLLCQKSSVEGTIEGGDGVFIPMGLR